MILHTQTVQQEAILVTLDLAIYVKYQLLLYDEWQFSCNIYFYTYAKNTTLIFMPKIIHIGFKESRCQNFKIPY